jgi:hypothetical protein
MLNVFNVYLLLYEWFSFLIIRKNNNNMSDIYFCHAKFMFHYCTYTFGPPTLVATSSYRYSTVNLVAANTFNENHDYSVLHCII